MKYDITFKCTQGELKLESCSKIPGENELPGMIKSLTNVRLGELKTIEIELKKL